MARTRIPLWLLCLLVFFLLHGWAILLAASAGHLSQFLLDPRWTILTLGPALGAFVMGYTPGALARFWRNLRPWLADSEEDIASLETSTQKLLTRFFWPFFLLLTFFMGVFSFLDDQVGWFQDYANIGFLKYLPVSTAPFVGYFVGGALAVASSGLGVFARSLRRLDLRPGFILEGGKGALKPFNQLLWAIWGIFTLPTIFIVALSVFIGSTADSADSLWGSTAGGILFVMLCATLVVPHLFMNQWLAQEKAQEVGRLRRALQEAAELPADGNAVADVLRQMHRHQSLSHQLQEARSFSPTLVDTRFMLQISTSVTGIVLANIVLRTLIVRLTG